MLFFVLNQMKTEQLYKHIQYVLVWMTYWDMWWIALVSQTGFTECKRDCPNQLIEILYSQLFTPAPLSTTWAGAALLTIRSWHNNLITSDILISWVRFCCTGVQVPTPLRSEHSWCNWYNAFRYAVHGVITVQILTEFYCFDDALHRNSSNPSSILLLSVCEATRQTHRRHCLKSADGKKLHAIYTVTSAWS